jgi:hypothetical protein
MSVELGDDATYPLRGLSFISFLMSSHDVLFVLGLGNNIL